MKNNVSRLVNALARRNFLSRTGLAAGAVRTAPAIVPSSAFGTSGKVALSNRITLAFIGTGRQAA
ncbi:MAG TPA: hypothetical protein VNZ22_17315 [Bacillota bacterium]|nr:hypothetical protein [Bacillota bacterium]